MSSYFCVFVRTNILCGDLLPSCYVAKTPDLKTVIRKLDSLGVTGAVMVHVGKHGVEAGAGTMTGAWAHVHVDAVDVHDVDGLHDFILTEHITQLKCITKKLYTMLLMIVPKIWLLFSLKISVPPEI